MWKLCGASGVPPQMKDGKGFPFLPGHGAPSSCWGGRQGVNPGLKPLCVNGAGGSKLSQHRASCWGYIGKGPPGIYLEYIELGLKQEELVILEVLPPASQNLPNMLLGTTRAIADVTSAQTPAFGCSTALSCWSFCSELHGA